MGVGEDLGRASALAHLEDALACLTGRRALGAETSRWLQSVLTPFGGSEEEALSRLAMGACPPSVGPLLLAMVAENAGGLRSWISSHARLGEAMRSGAPLGEADRETALALVRRLRTGLIR
jgi:hypothetical protein